LKDSHSSVHSSKHVIKIKETDKNTQSLNNAISAKNVSEVTQFFHAAIHMYCTLITCSTRE